MADYGIITDTDTIRIERLLSGPVERVWAYLTQSDLRRQWLAAGGMDLQPGGGVEHVFRNSDLSAPDDPPPAKYAHLACAVPMSGTIIACEPPSLLEYAWGDASQVRFELEPEGGKPRLTGTHARLATRTGMINVAAGWHAHLDILAARLEDREPPSFWGTHAQLEAEYEGRVP